MAKLEFSTKRLQLDKANVMIVTVVSVACFVTVFSLVAAKSLVSQLAYQNKVIGKKETTKREMIASIKGRDQLVKSYESFVASGINIIGGVSTGTSDRDGDNAKIVLDALPSKYDYPALTSSLEKLTSKSGMTITAIAGVDDEVNQAGTAASSKPEVVEMPFTLSVTGDKTNTEQFLMTLHRSIRPIQVQQVVISGSDSKLTTGITAKTYYQPATTFEVKKEVVK